MRWRWGIAVLLGALVAMAALTTSGLAVDRGAGSHPWVSERYITRFALKEAAIYGDPRPTLIQHAQGTRYAANVVASGDLIFDWSWAYLIAMRGHFELTSTYARDGSTPPADPFIHGSVVTVVLNPRTGEGEDGGISNRYPDLAKLGPVRTDYRRTDAGPTTKIASRESRYGRIVTNSAHYTLYAFCTLGHGAWRCTRGERFSSSRVRPLIARGRMVAGKDVRQNRLGTRKLRSGQRQVTYFGMPLYTYRGDSKPGQANGALGERGSQALMVVTTKGQPACTGCGY